MQKHKYCLMIAEHREEVLTYSDTSKEKFLERTKTIISDYLDRRVHAGGAGGEDLKNVQIHIYQDR